MDSLSNSPSLQEVCLTGDQLGLPVVKRLGLLRSQKASRISWHSHDCYEILMLADGATEYEFRDKKILELTGGHFLVIPPGIEHRGLHNIRRPARLCGILFDPTALDVVRGTPFTTADLTWIMAQIDLGLCDSHRMSYEMKGSFKLLLANLKKFEPEDRSAGISLRSLLCAILHDAAKRLATERTLEPKIVVQKAIQYMKHNLDVDASIASLTKSVGCSRARLFVLFKESTGMTPNDFWQRLRIDLSVEMLKDPGKSITDVAFEVGFSSSQYFCTVFRKYTGTTPSAYRRADADGNEPTDSVQPDRTPRRLTKRLG